MHMHRKDSLASFPRIYASDASCKSKMLLQGPCIFVVDMFQNSRADHEASCASIAVTQQ